MSIKKYSRLLRWDSSRIIRKLLLVVQLEGALVVVVREDDGIDGFVKIC